MDLFNIRWDTAKERLGKLHYKSERLKGGKWVRKVEDIEDIVRMWNTCNCSSKKRGERECGRDNIGRSNSWEFSISGERHWAIK